MHGARINNESVTSGTDPLKKPVCPLGSAYDVRLGVDLFLKSESSREALKSSALAEILSTYRFMLLFHVCWVLHLHLDKQRELFTS